MAASSSQDEVPILTRNLEFLGFPAYEATSDGKIFKVSTGQEMKSQIVGPYKYITLQNVIIGKPKTVIVHRLIAFAFVPNPNPDDKSMTVDHCNRDPLDNRHSNLRWVTKSEQVLNRDKYIKKTQRKVVLQYNPDGTLFRRWESSIEAAEYYNTNPQYIRGYCNPTCRKRDVSGFLWEYEEEQIDPEEEWRQIDMEDHETVYVSNKGRARREGDAPSIGTLTGHGYRVYSIRNTKTRKTSAKRIHKLVALAFLGHPLDESYIVNHLNGRKDDNRPENLEYTTRAANTQHAYDTGLIDNSAMKRSVIKIHPTEDKVVAIYDGIREAAEKNDGDHSNIRASCISDTRLSCGYRWRYADDANVQTLIEEFNADPSSGTELPEIKIQRTIAVICVDADTQDILAHYLSITEASEKTGIDLSNIASACSSNGVGKSGGYKWYYANDPNWKEKLEAFLAGPLPIEQPKKKIPQNMKPVIKIDPITDSIIDFYDTMKDAARLNNIKCGYIHTVCIGKQKTTGGFGWEFVAD